MGHDNFMQTINQVDKHVRNDTKDEILSLYPFLFVENDSYTKKFLKIEIILL